VNCTRDQTRNPTSLAQATPSHLSESCRVLFWSWFALLAQARDARLGEVARKPEPFLSAISRPSETYWCSKRQGTRLGENDLPKRGRDEKGGLFA